MKPSLEHQFLPAVLEIQDTPPSPVGRLIIWLITLFFISSLIWASIGHIDIVSVAAGKIIPNGQVKVIQPLELGTVIAIHVKEGKRVKQGESLIELDPSTVNAEISQLTMELNLAKQQRKRLQWLTKQQKIQQKQLPDLDDLILTSQWREYKDRLNTLQSEKNKRLAEQATAKQQEQKLAEILPLISQRSVNEKKLVDKKLFPRQKYLETEQQRLSTFYDYKSQHSRVNELQQTIAEINAQMSHTRSEFAKTNLEKQEEAEHKIKRIKQELIKAGARQKARHLVAPIDGIIQQLAVHTVGGIVTPAQELMIIVPQSAQLEIEAYVENKDIGFVKEGQSAAIKLDAFPFTKYGTLDGQIIDLSDDAVSDEDKGLIYKALVALKQTSMQVEGKQVKPGIGMSVSVEIKTGQRRLIEFFLAPLLRYKDESVRER